MPANFQCRICFYWQKQCGKIIADQYAYRPKSFGQNIGYSGKTQLINHFEIVSSDKRTWHIVDLPGYGYATVSQKARNNWSNMIESYIRKRENLVCLFVLIDSRHSPQAIDLSFINSLGEWQVPFVLVFTKIDKNKPGATTKNVDAFLKALAENWEEPPPYFITSAIKKEGRKQILDYIEALNSSFTRL